MSDRVTGIATEPGYTIVENASLEGRTTFRVPARAEMFIDIRDVDALPVVANYGGVRNAAPFILGGGSNVLFTRNWPGVMMSLSATGISMLEDRPERSIVRVAAGENWNDVVQWSLMQGFVGLENLVLIPGLTGAAPIQNIGAYGVEVCEFVHAVDVFDWHTRTFARLDNAQCAFAYRDSLFKRDPSRYLVTAVEFALSRSRELQLDYAGVHEELAAMNVSAPTAPLVAEAICRLRTRKLPNPILIGNAGSFFKNPIVDEAIAQALTREHPSLPSWRTDSARKLSAAWLIDACGLKGVRDGDAGVSAQHALVLVNHGRATGVQIWALAQRVIDSVRERFGVTLEPEPVIV